MDHLEARVLRTCPELAALADEWDRLYAAASPPATPFQAHAWVTAWAGAYVPAGELFVVTVRRRGRLVAAAPLFRDRRGPWQVLTPLGGAQSDHSDVLVAADERGALDALGRALLDAPGWQVLDLPELRPDAAARAWTSAWPGRVTRLPASTVLELPALPLPELLDRMPAKSAKTMRRKLRKVDQAGIEVRHVPADEVPQAVDRLIRLHEEQWTGRGGNPEHRRERFRRHLTTALTRMVDDGTATLTEYSADGEVRLGQILLLGHGTVSAYLAGISPRLRQDVDTAALVMRHDPEFAVQQGAARYSMLRGLEDYKFRWRPEPFVQERLLLSRPGMSGPAYVLLARARAGAVAVVKTRAPWVREMRDRVVRRVRR
ncbi:glycosyl transferase family 1 [Blastococcus sp. TF02-09]|uniref:GNAT family N-acetyltransferase n=1 Tax=Blastococcus sp. TF02-09 TaxID=2250576 RepID=UPI000DEA8816|nr:GNAT family N-acetyltransferase [Blastococcus sp. TF02-9]RBY74829.1 glycosyl transferase family 1 [Blastococcus sp. TF02-9]